MLSFVSFSEHFYLSPRLQRQVELGQMASRPFSSMLVYFDDSLADQQQPSKSKKHEFPVIIIVSSHHMLVHFY